MSFDSKRHHWWPRRLSAFWADTDSCVTRLGWDGAEVRRPPNVFGRLTHAHNVRLPKPWGSSFEQDFGRADGQFPDLVGWLESLEPTAIEAGDLLKRFQAREIPVERRQQLGTCLASLVARSPSYRQRLRLAVEDVRFELGLSAFKVDETIVAANVQDSFESFERAIARSGKFTVAYAGQSEFTFGDGFLHNFTSRDYIHRPIGIVPLTPKIAVIFNTPASHRIAPAMAVIGFDEEEVAFVNQSVQVYSRDQILFRRHCPVIGDAFRSHAYLEFEYHRTPWLEYFLEARAEFRVAMAS